MTDKPADKPRVLLRPLSGVSTGRLASLRAPSASLQEPNPRGVAPLPKPSDSNREIVISSGSSTPSQSAQMIAPTLSTRQLLAQAQKKEAEKINPTSAPKTRKVSQLGSKGTGAGSTPWKTMSPVKSEGLSSSKFSSVAFSNRSNDSAYRPQALPLCEGKGPDEPVGSMFVRSDGSLRERELMLVQMPPLLPTLHGGLQTDNTDVGTALADMPDGRIGTLRIYKDGRTVMVIGNIEFDVLQGHKAAFREEIAVICPQDEEVLFFGEVTRKVIVSPVFPDTMHSDDHAQPPSSGIMQVD